MESDVAVIALVCEGKPSQNGLKRLRARSFPSVQHSERCDARRDDKIANDAMENGEGQFAVRGRVPEPIERELFEHLE